MSDLQNRLDRQKPPDFDRAALWERIERPGHKRRRFILLFWLGGLLLSMAGGAAWVSYAGDSEMGTTALIHNEMDDKEQAGIMEADGEEESASANPILKRGTGRSDELKKDIQSIEQTAGTSPKSYEKDHLVDAELVSQKEKQHALLLMPVLNQPVSISTNARAPSTSLVYETSKAPTSGQSDGANDGLAIHDRVAGLSFLPERPVEALKSEKRSYYFSAPSSLDEAGFKRNEITVGGGVAGQLHSSICNSKDNEATRLGYFLGAGYKRKLNRKWYLLAEAQYTQHHSKIATSTSFTEQFLSPSSEIEVLKTTTHYQLYNEYHRLDFSAGAGYSWKFRGLEIGLDASIGIAKWIEIDANYLDEQGVLQELNNAGSMEVMLFGKLSGSVRKALANDFFVGTTIAVQSPLEVSGTSAECMQEMLPVYVGILFGKRF